MGIEASGVVLEIGPGARRFAVGDRVMGLFPDGTGTIATTDQRLLAKMPAGWSHSAGRHDLGGFRHGVLRAGGPGRRQAGPAGVGARRRRWGGNGRGAAGPALGLEVFATASRGKWDTLRAMGFDDDHIADSRSLEFEDKFRAVTGGRAWTWCWTRWPATSWMPPCGCCPRRRVPGDGQDRHPRPRGRRPGTPRCALPRLRPLRSRPGAHPADARRVGRAVRPRRATAVAGDGL